MLRRRLFATLALLLVAAGAFPVTPANDSYVVPSGTNVFAGREASFVPPYTVPTEVNTSTLIGTNSAHDVRPGTHSAGQWETALFGAYGGGTMVPKWSAGGAYAISDTGGHSDVSNVDLTLFDFSDATWKFFANANGVASRSTAFTVTDTTGAPYYEVSAATSGQFPAPPHAYGTQVATDDGDQGTLLYVTRGAVGTETPSAVSPTAHQQDLSTRLWTRAATGSAAYSNYEGSVAFDATAGRLYVAGPDIGAYQQMAYLRRSDMTWQTTPTYGWPSQPGADYGRLLMADAKRVLLFHRTGSLQGLDVTNDTTIANGWVTLTFSGTPPTSGNMWVWHPGTGKFYLKVGNTGNTLAVLTPPTGSGMSGTWSFTTVTIGGAGLPDRTIALNHYTGLIYVPALGLLAWFYGPGQVAVIKV